MLPQKQLLILYQPESAKKVTWFRENIMVVKCDKFQTLKMNKMERDHASEDITIDQCHVEEETSIKLY